MLRHKALRAFLSAMCVSALLSGPVRAESTPTIETVSINAGINSEDSSIALGENLLFGADDGVHGWELWASDGTAAGTQLVADICPGICSSFAEGFVRMKEFVYFWARADEDSGPDLWRTDGTSDGTERVAFIFHQTNTLKVVGSTLYWTAYSADYNLLWLYKSDGTQMGTRVVDTFRQDWDNAECFGSNEIVAIGSTVYFAAEGLFSNKGTELWRSNGTLSGTKIVKDVRVGTRSSCPDNLVVLGKTIYFSVGGAGGTATELWKSNGTAGGTTRVRRIQSAPVESGIGCFVSAGTVLYFCASDGVHGNELWRSNGTFAGTKMVKDINRGTADGFGYSFVIGSKQYFWADDGVHGWEPWTSDGTATGTMIIADVNVGRVGSVPDNGEGGFVSLGSWIYFVANNGSKRSVYRTRDGVTEPLPLTDGANSVSIVNGKLAVSFETTLSFFEAPLERAVSYKKPTIKVSGKLAVGGSLIASPGIWGGFPVPTFSYQWYSCGGRVLIELRVIPGGCEPIAGRTAGTLKLTRAERYRYIAVLVTATSAGTSPTQWLSKSTSYKVSN
jgi:ELWxxDGT repeat protein